VAQLGNAVDLTTLPRRPTGSSKPVAEVPVAPATRPAGMLTGSPIGESSGGLPRAASAKDVGAQLTFPSARAGALDVVFQPNEGCAQLFAPPSERASHREIQRRAKLPVLGRECTARALGPRPPRLRVRPFLDAVPIVTSRVFDG
jgi:hypothetical protein